jgi:predicted porin
MHIGLGLASGSSEVATGAKTATKATLLDFQGQTTLGANDLSVYASYGSAPASTATETNKWNAGTANAKKAMGVGADYSVIPHVLHVGGAFLSADNGATTKNKETKLMVQAIYDMTENTAFHVTFVKSSGTVYDGAAVTSPTTTTLMLETSW